MLRVSFDNGEAIFEPFQLSNGERRDGSETLALSLSSVGECWFWECDQTVENRLHDSVN